MGKHVAYTAVPQSKEALDSIDTLPPPRVPAGPGWGVILCRDKGGRVTKPFLFLLVFLFSRGGGIVYYFGIPSELKREMGCVSVGGGEPRGQEVPLSRAWLLEPGLLLAVPAGVAVFSSSGASPGFRTSGDTHFHGGSGKLVD